MLSRISRSARKSRERGRIGPASCRPIPSINLSSDTAPTLRIHQQRRLRVLGVDPFSDECIDPLRPLLSAFPAATWSPALLKPFRGSCSGSLPQADSQMEFRRVCEFEKLGRDFSLSMSCKILEKRSVMYES